MIRLLRLLLVSRTTVADQVPFEKDESAVMSRRLVTNAGGGSAADNRYTPVLASHVPAEGGGSGNVNVVQPASSPSLKSSSTSARAPAVQVRAMALLIMIVRSVILNCPVASSSVSGIGQTRSSLHCESLIPCFFLPTCFVLDDVMARSSRSETVAHQRRLNAWTTQIKTAIVSRFRGTQEWTECLTRRTDSSTTCSRLTECGPARRRQTRC
jgi:hypothetical protein